MNRRMFVAGMGTTALGGSALLASGASSRVESQREVKIRVADDEDAYLSLLYPRDYTRDRSISCDRTIELVTITNQLKETIDEVTIENLTVEPDDLVVNEDTLIVPDRIGVGEYGKVEISVECEPGTDTDRTVITFDIVAKGVNHTVVAKGGEGAERTIAVSCSCSPTTTLLNGKGISFIAFCSRDGGSVTVSGVEVTHENSEGEPTGVSWTTAEPVTEIVLWGGREWRRYDYPEGATTGIVTMSRDDADNSISNDPPGPPSADFQDGVGVRRPNEPCGCGASTKIEWNKNKGDFAIAEKTDGDC